MSWLLDANVVCEATKPKFDVRDTQIAAIAREYGLTVATRNVKHFPFCKVEDPFSKDTPVQPGL